MDKGEIVRYIYNELRPKAMETFPTIAKELDEFPVVMINPRLTTTAGRFMSTGVFEFNPRFMDHERFHETVIHEYAHFVNHLFGHEGHDRLFYAIDVILGGKGTRCHNYLNR